MRKKILVLGYGRSTQSAIDVLQQNIDADICVFDEMQKDIEALPEGVTQIDTIDSIVPAEILFCLKSPGIAYSKDYVQFLLTQQVEIMTDVELFLGTTEGTVIAITGTNGKTTVTTLIGEVLKTKYNDVRVCGNIGIPIAEVCREATKETVFVVELSSFQLKGTKNFKPDIAIILNIADAHLDYHETKLDYVSSKAKIFKNQTADDILIYNGDDEQVKNIIADVQSCQLAVGYKKEHDIFIDEKNIIFKHQSLKTDIIKVPGVHNRYNVAYAYAVGILLDVPKIQIESAIEKFSGVKHRLQYVKTINNVKIYNDSKSTNEYAVQTALSAFNEPVIWICGGYDRHIPYTNLNECQLKNVKKMVIYGEMKNTYISIAKQYHLEYVLCECFEDLFKESMNTINEGDVVLFSPGAASYDLFQNFEQRGDAFLNLVENYSK